MTIVIRDLSDVVGTPRESEKHRTFLGGVGIVA